MSQPKLRSIELDDGTIIKIQVNDTIEPSDLLHPEPLTPEPTFNDIDPPRSGIPAPNYADDDDNNARGSMRRPKGWNSSQQNRLPDPQAPTGQTAPAQRVGTLVKAYTQDLVKDIRSTVLTDVEIEKFTLEFGVSLDTELNAYIASSSLECSVKVAIECKLAKPRANPDSPTNS